MELHIGKIIFQGFIYAFIALFIGISQSAGIGGGPILNISLMLGLGYQARQSMAITYIFLIGGSIASMHSNFGKFTKDKDKLLIDYNLVMITLPMTVSGSIFGALFNHYISEFVITVAFSLLLSYLAWSSLQKYRQATRLTSLKTPMIKMKILNKVNMSERLKAILVQEKQIFPIEKIKLFVLIIGYSIVLLLFKGGKTFNSIINLQPCGLGSWICVLLHFIISFYVSKSIGIKQIQNDQQKQRLGFVFQQRSNMMSQRMMRNAMILGFAGGMTGGALGIGGAIILVPAWIQLGIDQNIATSSSAPLIFSSAIISAMIAFFCNFYESFSSVICFFVLSLVASSYIKKFIMLIKEKYQMEGIIFILLIIVMVVSLACLIPFELHKLIVDPTNFFQFGHLC